MNSGNFRIFANVGPGFICGKLPKAMADPGTDGGERLAGAGGRR